MTLVSPVDLLLGKFVSTLSDMLTEQAVVHPERAFPLRMAIHVGEVHHGRQGPFGEAVDIALRMLDAPALRRWQYQKSPFVLAVSDDIYRSVTSQGYDGRTFEPHINFEMDGRLHTGWIQAFEADGQYGRHEKDTHADRTA